MTVPRPLRVGLNLLFLGEQAGGVGRYATELPGALLEAEPATEISVFTSASAPAQLRHQPWADRIRWVRLPIPAGSASAQLAEHALLPLFAVALRLEVLHSPANTGPVITPGCAAVVSLMDLIWLQHADEWNPDPRAQRAMRRQVGHAVRHADRLLAISETAAADISTGLGVDRARIAVTPLGIRESAVVPEPEAALRARFGLGDRRVVLCVAQKRRYKNLVQIVEALARLPENVIAVLPGARTAYEAELRRRAGELGVTERLVLPEWVSDTDLAGLYALAAAFVLPSLAEGFGLPVLEAMAHGTPVACSDIPVLREVAGEAALFFGPHDADALAGVLTRMLEDSALRETLRVLGRERVQTFTWRRTGEATLRAYRDVLNDETGS